MVAPGRKSCFVLGQIFSKSHFTHFAVPIFSMLLSLTTNLFALYFTQAGIAENAGLHKGGLASDSQAVEIIHVISEGMAVGRGDAAGGIVIRENLL